MADNPPRRRRASTPTDDRPPMPEDKSQTETQTESVKAPGKPASKALKDKLETTLVSMSLPFAAAGDMHCAGVFIQRGPVVAEAWANLAAESPAVKRVLESMLKGGAWMGAISSTMMIVVPVARHHGVPIPDPFTSVILGKPETPPEPPVARNGNTPDGEPSNDPTNPAAYPGVHNSANN